MLVGCLVGGVHGGGEGGRTFYDGEDLGGVGDVDRQTEVGFLLGHNSQESAADDGGVRFRTSGVGFS